MRFRELGNTGQLVSVLGFGCMRLPVVDRNSGSIDRPLATRMIRHAIDHGVNYLDTAWSYHSDDFSKPGSSEPFLAEALKNGYREKVFLATKLPCWMVESREDFDRYLNVQLQRLDTEVLDFYLLHSLNRKSWGRMKQLGVNEFLDQALKSGKIRFAGFSFHDDLELFKEIVDFRGWSFFQIMYNYYDEHFQAGRAGLSYASGKGLGAVIMEPLRGGALVSGLPEEAQKILQEAVPGRSMAGWAFRWLWSQPEVQTVLSGMSTMEQLEENLLLARYAVAGSWSVREAEAVRKANELIRRLQRVPCTQCGYCMPCPHGVDIPRNFSLFNDYQMLRDQGALVRYHRLLKEPQRALSCIGCGECLDKCPQKIPIPDELSEMAGIFRRAV